MCSVITKAQTQTQHTHTNNAHKHKHKYKHKQMHKHKHKHIHTTTTSVHPKRAHFPCVSPVTMDVSGQPNTGAAQRGKC